MKCQIISLFVVKVNDNICQKFLLLSDEGCVVVVVWCPRSKISTVP